MMPSQAGSFCLSVLPYLVRSAAPPDVHGFQEGERGRGRGSTKRLLPAFLWLGVCLIAIPRLTGGREIESIFYRLCGRKGIRKGGRSANFWCLPPSLFPASAGQGHFPTPAQSRPQNIAFIQREKKLVGGGVALSGCLFFSASTTPKPLSL